MPPLGIELSILITCIGTYFLIVAIQYVDTNKVNAEKWFSSYKFTVVLLSFKNVTVLKQGRMITSYDAVEAIFELDETRYSFKLTKNNPVHKSASLTVNNVPIALSRFPEYANIYQGHAIDLSLNFKTVLKLSQEGVDAVIYTENDTFFIEPVTRYGLQTNTTSKYKVDEYNELSYRCIFYKSSDVFDTFNKSIGILFEEKHRQFSPKSNGSRNKRSVSDSECTLHIVADHTFHEDVGHSSISNTISEMSYLIAQADLIFRATDFDGEGTGDNIGFYVTDITIYTEHQGYKMINAPTVENYLETFSEYDFNANCLAIAFTSREFADGVIGLAWVASSSRYGSAGGICQTSISYGSRTLNLNTALVTTTNDGERLPMYKSALTLTHEFGHSFGSPHDDSNDLTCSPEGEYGNYLMYPYSSTGNKPNNYVFSTCSISYMFPVVRNKGTCFKDTIPAVCGNGIREDGEECDCGHTSTCTDIDPCCTPSDASFPNTDTPCTLSRSQGSTCSPRVSPCCTDNCAVVTNIQNKLCKAGSDCTVPSFCDGLASECPATQFKENNTECENGRNACQNGMCIGSICTIYGQSECTCGGLSSCLVCCSLNSSDCSPIQNQNFNTIPKQYGESCNDRLGFCNGEGMCVLQNTQGTVHRFNQVFTQTTVNEAREWFVSHWYYVVAAVGGLLFLIALFVSTCRGQNNVQTDAFMYGQFSRIQREAELQKGYLEKRKLTVKSAFENKIANASKGQQVKSLENALSRMMVFFPTVPPSVLVKTLKQCSNEDAAVRLLLIKKYPFRRVCLPVSKV